MSRVLIIDDESPVRIALAKLGDWEKYKVSEILNAENGKEALELMRLYEPEFVFLDICMPVMDGLEFLEKAKEEYPLSQFIIVSGYDDFTYAQRALHFGATDYLLKPVDRESVNNALAHALDKHSLDLMEVKKEEENTSSKYTADEACEYIYNFINDHYAENIKISIFADKFFFSKEYISRHFKNKYNHGIYEYVLRVRMQKAAELLKDESIKIQDIGLKVGFADNNHFSKAFKNYYDMSPSDYRKS